MQKAAFPQECRQSFICQSMTLCIPSTALFVLFATAARTRIIPSDLRRLYNGLRLLLFKIELFSTLFAEKIIPLRELIEPVALTDEQVLEILEKVKAESYVTKSGVSDDMFLKFVNDVKNK